MDRTWGNVHRVSEELRISNRFIYKIFKENIGKTPRDYYKRKVVGEVKTEDTNGKEKTVLIDLHAAKIYATAYGFPDRESGNRRKTPIDWREEKNFDFLKKEILLAMSKTNLWGNSINVRGEDIDFIFRRGGNNGVYRIFDLGISTSDTGIKSLNSLGKNKEDVPWYA